jgi:hypothetical protein
VCVCVCVYVCVCVCVCVHITECLEVLLASVVINNIPGHCQMSLAL